MTKILAMPGEGERLDRFELVAELASGGMATVYLARFVGMAGFKRFVAIKRLHPHLAKEQEFIQMFLDEARLAARLHHPNVVPILEIGVQNNDQYYLVMEYIEGDTVGHLMARAANVNRKIPVPIVIRIMLDTLTGLNAAHDLTDEQGTPLEIVHRDVSPQNILVGVDGVARITDFGVAKAQARLANATQGGQLKGKLAYMSPEQVRGNLPVDRRADVFAAGIVLWELLTGHRLFKADGEADTLFKVVAAEVPPIRDFEPGVPPEVEVVVRRALAQHAQQRFASAADFAEALEQAARTYNLVATVRTAAAFVNEMIGLDISQQREIVRAWLGRSDVSRSGVLDKLDRSEAPTPLIGTPAAPAAPPAAQLSSLVDDDLDMATRVDDPDADQDPFEATRVAPKDGSAAASGPFAPSPNGGPLMSLGQDPRAAHMSFATSPEFLPQAAPPQTFGPPPASGPNPPAPVAYPWGPVPVKTVVPPRGLPVWALLIPAVIIIGGAVFLGLHQARAPHPPPKPSATTTTTPPPTMTISATTTLFAEPPPTTSAAMTATPQATIDTTEPAPRATATWRPRPHPTSTSAAAVDNKEFGGRK
jgi:serine/threonine protein kinase